MESIALLNSKLTHGAYIISGSPDRNVDNQPVARLGDIVYCPIHHINKIIAVTVTQETDSHPVAHVSALAACGAVIISGSPDLIVG